MNDRTWKLAQSFRLAAVLVLHGKVSDTAAWEAAKHAAELTLLARKIDRHNEARCSYPTTTRQDNAAAKACNRVREIVAQYGAVAHIGGDPRGPAVRIYWADELPKGDPDCYTDRMLAVEV